MPDGSLPCPALRQAGLVVGMRAEARLLRGLGPVGIGGGTPAGAAAAAERLLAGGARGLVSVGLAGGLDPRLVAGDVVVAGAVRHEGRDFPVDEGLAAALGGVNAGLMLAPAEAVGSVAAKAALFAATGAVAVDLESGAVAAVAARHGVPFAALRVICDPAGRDLPEAALRALGADGGIRVGALVGSLLRRPGQVAGLLRLAGDAAAARRALAAAARRLRGGA